MATLQLKLGSTVKAIGIKGLSGGAFGGNAETVYVKLYNSDTAISDEKTVLFKVVESGENAYTQTQAGVMFAVDSGKTVNKIVFQRTISGNKKNIFQILLSGEDAETFSFNGTFTINSVKITLK